MVLIVRPNSHGTEQTRTPKPGRSSKFCVLTNVKDGLVLLGSDDNMIGQEVENCVVLDVRSRLISTEIRSKLPGLL